MKKIIVILSVLVTLNGCIYHNRHDEEGQYYHYPTLIESSIYYGGSFNEEHYIWENFIFPTNRTEGLK